MTKDEVTNVARGLYFAAGANLESDQAQIGYNPATAIGAAWQPKRHGPAVTAERAINGGAIQTFANGYALWYDGAQTIEIEL